MAVDPPSPSEFLGNFAGFVETFQRYLEAEYGNDAGEYKSVADRAAAEAPFAAARTWLVERWDSLRLSSMQQRRMDAFGRGCWTATSWISQLLSHLRLLRKHNARCAGAALQDSPIFASEQFHFPEMNGTPEKGIDVVQGLNEESSFQKASSTGEILPPAEDITEHAKAEKA